MLSNPVGWFEIYVDNIERAKSFYEIVFQSALKKLHVEFPEMWAFSNESILPGSGGALVYIKGFSAGGNSTIVYFSCEDCALECGRVENAGGRIHKPKFSIGEYGFICLVYDTEGNMIGLHSQK